MTISILIAIVLGLSYQFGPLLLQCPIQLLHGGQFLFFVFLFSVRARRAFFRGAWMTCGGWHEPIPALLRGTPSESMAGYPVYDRDLLEADVLRKPGKEKEKKGAPPAAQRRVTLIGDAAHPMTPFRAQGANQALSDAVLLAESLADAVQQHGPRAGVDAALPLFEQPA